MKKPLQWASGIVLLGLLVIGFMVANGSWPGADSGGVLSGYEVTLYKSPTCGCCEKYGAYLEERGDASVTSIDQGNLTPIKRKFGIPGNLESCHTSIVGEYVVEGHVPLEAVETLLEEEPDITGIALPGMPLGSPGMNGLKTERFEIYAIQNDGSYVPYITL